jgi:hypothetical protein
MAGSCSVQAPLICDTRRDEPAQLHVIETATQAGPPLLTFDPIIATNVRHWPVAGVEPPWDAESMLGSWAGLIEPA